MGLVRGLAANLRAGTRLALGLAVGPAEFRVTAGQYAMTVAASLAAWFAGGLLRNGFPGQIDGQALQAGLAQIPLLLLGCLLAASLLGEAALALALAVFITSTDVIFEAAAVLVRRLTDHSFAAPYASWMNAAFMLWALYALLRAQALASGWRGLRSAGAGLVFTGMLAFFAFAMPRTELWVAWEEPAPQAAQGLAREDLFHAQGGLLEAKLGALEPERSGIDDLYFVGAAPYALQDTFARELEAAMKVMDERFDTAGRSIALVNHEATLASFPLATVTSLRAALAHLGRVMNPDEDILFLLLSTHGRENHELAFEMPPLALTQMNPTLLARMLADSGIRWKVVVISACYSGGFVEQLKDEYSLVITAAAADRSSFGCESDSEMTWFGRAFFAEALRGTRSLPQAVERARASVAARERREGREPSNPQVHLGEAMAAKLQVLRLRLEGAAPGQVAAGGGN